MNSIIVPQCKLCKHCKPCKHLENGEWVWFKICDLFTNEPNGFCITVEEDDCCEEYSERVVDDGN